MFNPLSMFCKIYDYEKAKSNYEIIKEFCTKYRNNLTIISGLLGETTGLIKSYEYIKFINELSDEEFIGNYLTGLLNEECINVYKSIINNEISFEEYVYDNFGDDIGQKYLELINK